MKEQVERLGFIAWADNVIANVLEDLPKDVEEFTCERQGAEVTAYFQSEVNIVQIIVRAYVPGWGWQHHERILKR